MGGCVRYISRFAFGTPPVLYRDPRCVFVADSLAQANVVASWLEGQGVRAEVMNQATMGWVGSPAGMGALGIEIWVTDAAQVPNAVALLGERAVSQLAEKSVREQAGPVEVVCERCGKPSIFPAAQRGSVQECPHCTAYVDVEGADADEEWGDPGTAAESPNQGPGSDAITDKGDWGLTKS